MSGFILQMSRTRVTIWLSEWPKVIITQIALLWGFAVNNNNTFDFRSDSAHSDIISRPCFMQLKNKCEVFFIIISVYSLISLGLLLSILRQGGMSLKKSIFRFRKYEKLYFTASFPVKLISLPT